MNEFCYVLMETVLIGCHAAFNVVAVTLDQNYAYSWLRSEAPEFTSRRVEQKPFISP